MVDEATTFEEVYLSWPGNQPGLCEAFSRLTDLAQKQPDSTYTLLSRPGVSYSFRSALAAPWLSRTRPVFFLLDVVVSEVDPWFLSVCFYEDEISDPEDLGDTIPQGLFHETGYCFDVDDFDRELLDYLGKRIIEAHRNALGSHGG